MSFESKMPTDRLAIDLALLVVRLILGTIFIAHGAQKLLGTFGGSGLADFVVMMGPIGYLVAIGEFFGAVGLIFGFLSRFSAAAIMVIMMGAIALVHFKNGFFMSSNGLEYPLANIGLATTIFLAGPGRFALGQYLPLPKSKKTGRVMCCLE